MADRLRFHPLVAEDLRVATEWYDGISLNLGNTFRMHVNARFDDIGQRPESFAAAFEDVRFVRIKRFPYLVLFRESEDFIHCAWRIPRCPRSSQVATTCYWVVASIANGACYKLTFFWVFME